MPTFTPTTYNLPISGKEQVLGGDANHESMWRHYGSPIPVGYVVIITSGAANASPGSISPSVDTMAGADEGSGDGGLAIFSRGATYTVTNAEDTILTAAGYTVT